VRFACAYVKYDASTLKAACAVRCDIVMGVCMTVKHCSAVFVCLYWGVRIGNDSTPKAERRTNLETEAEPQQIVAQRLLSCLQYLVP
jgi:hypothetical protein